MGWIICPQARENGLQQDYLESLIYILAFGDMVDWGLTSTQGDGKGMKKVWEAALAGGTEVNCFLVSEVTTLPFHREQRICDYDRMWAWVG